MAEAREDLYRLLRVPRYATQDHLDYHSWWCRNYYHTDKTHVFKDKFCMHPDVIHESEETLAARLNEYCVKLLAGSKEMKTKPNRVNYDNQNPYHGIQMKEPDLLPETECVICWEDRYRALSVRRDASLEDIEAQYKALKTKYGSDNATNPKKRSEKYRAAPPGPGEPGYIEYIDRIWYETFEDVRKRDDYNSRFPRHGLDRENASENSGKTTKSVGGMSASAKHNISATTGKSSSAKSQREAYHLPPFLDKTARVSKGRRKVNEGFLEKKLTDKLNAQWSKTRPGSTKPQATPEYLFPIPQGVSEQESQQWILSLVGHLGNIRPPIEKGTEFYVQRLMERSSSILSSQERVKEQSACVFHYNEAQCWAIIQNIQALKPRLQVMIERFGA